MKKIFSFISIHHEREEWQTVTDNIENGIRFRGTNLWILIFAIFIASIGLNVNSTAVIIGAMLISPLMGPIMGLGLGMGINDVSLLKRSIVNFSFAMAAALGTSTIYFLLTPISEAHSEILARTTPTVYDVLIAFFGGLTGIVAVASKRKGKRHSGVAIATALMPPLCTAGYGLATLQWIYFFGAFYLFLINTVFIALATFITVRLLKVPLHHLSNERADVRAKRMVWIVGVLTLLPSLYFGYDIVQQNRFTKKQCAFIKAEASINGDYLLNKTIDAKHKTITLVYGGRKITDAEVTALQRQLNDYNLSDATLTVKQGFASFEGLNNSEQFTQLKTGFESMQLQLKELQSQYDSITRIDTTAVIDTLVTRPKKKSRR